MKSLTTALLTFALATSAFCQIGGSFAPGSSTMTHLWFPASPAELIVNRPDVQHELNLTASQVSTIAGIAKANAKTFMEKVDENWQQIAKVLTPGQRKRTEQLAFEGSGIASALIPGLRDRLGITKSQLSKLADIQHSYLLREDKDLMESQTAETPVPLEQIKAARALRQQMIMDAIANVLTPAQSASIKAFAGPGFKFSDPAPKPISTWIRAMGMSG
jgi:hypothetical protein